MSPHCCDKDTLGMVGSGAPAVSATATLGLAGMGSPRARYRPGRLICYPYCYPWTPTPAQTHGDSHIQSVGALMAYQVAGHNRASGGIRHTPQGVGASEGSHPPSIVGAFVGRYFYNLLC